MKHLSARVFYAPWQLASVISRYEVKFPRGPSLGPSLNLPLFFSFLFFRNFLLHLVDTEDNKATGQPVVMRLSTALPPNSYCHCTSDNFILNCLPRHLLTTFNCFFFFFFLPLDSRYSYHRSPAAGTAINTFLVPFFCQTRSDRELLASLQRSLYSQISAAPPRRTGTDTSLTQEDSVYFHTSVLGTGKRSRGRRGFSIVNHSFCGI